MAGGAAVWCWCEVLPGCCCPLLYSYVGRGGVRSPTGAASSSRHGKAAHGKHPTEKGQQKRGRRGGGPCLPLFSRQSFGAGSGLFAGAAVVAVGRRESIAGHSFPRGRQNVSLHTFARLSGGGFYFFRFRFRRFQIYLCAFCQIAIIRYFFLFVYGHFVHLFSFRNHYSIFSGIVPCAILTAWYNVFCAKGRLHGTMLDSSVFAWYNAITAKETPQNRKEVKPHETF